MLAEVMKEAESGIPYNGAKEHCILDVEDRELTERLIGIPEPLTPLPKPRKKKQPGPKG